MMARSARLALLGAFNLSVVACATHTANETVVSTGIEAQLAQLGIQCASVERAATTEFSSLKLELVGRHISSNDFDTSSAEIVSYDGCSDQLYVVNAEDKSVDVLSFDAQGAPAFSARLDLEQAAEMAGVKIGAANSVVAKNGLVAVAIENKVKQLDGIIALYRSDDLSLLATFPAGALPDMVTMSEDSRYLVVANEGEPSDDYLIDPEGSVTLIDLASGITSDSASVTQINFHAFNDDGERAGELNGARTPRPHGASVAQDLEPEYVALTDDGKKAVISLQENNAIAVVDIASASVDGIFGLGTKSWAPVADGGQGYQLDATNKDDKFHRESYPQLVGYYMPDAIASFSVDGERYVVTANEGDGREYVFETTQMHCEQAGFKWDGDEYQSGGEDEDAQAYREALDDCISYTDETRAYKLKVDPTHPLMDESRYGKKGTIGNKKAIGRIKVVADDKVIAADQDVITFGARSFSIFRLDGEQVFDSGDQLSTMANSDQHWNASNDSQVSDDRSDDKGIEPEAVTIALIADKPIAFIGLERQGGVAVYDLSDPSIPRYLDFHNNRNFAEPVCSEVDEDGECDNDQYNPAAGDLGPESIAYFSRLGQHFIAVGNEVSGTTSVYRLNLQ
ncbi:choice-of-anchor I family protein [Aliagarivorans taiwanensis]|uniref:choice-of-anchor I family protein n=1 Tax=Aliagarivorans taiwanensis TaxID=561966 RepID=UPI00041B3F64|nr:choice-of-anchor I family protein [Aliagarivorans taiwanensis]